MRERERKRNEIKNSKAETWHPTHVYSVFWYPYYCNYSHLLQNASHIPFALTGLKFFASLTSTCSEPFDDELRELDDDLMLPNLRKPLPIDDLENDDFVSGGTNFKPTIMSPRYVARSSNGSLYKLMVQNPKLTKKKKRKKQTNIDITNKGIKFLLTL